MRERQRFLTGFTLIELIMVLILVGILVSIAVPAYRKAVLSSEGRAAVANLRAIHAAEKVIELETDAYAACGSAAACNTALRIDIPADTAYSYSVNTGGGNFTARATRVAPGDNCTYTITNSDTKPSSSPQCVYEQ